MTIDDAELLKTAIGLVAAIGTTLTGSVAYLFSQVVALNRKVGHMESEIEEYKRDIAEYKNCPIPQCHFRMIKLRKEWTDTVAKLKTTTS